MLTFFLQESYTYKDPITEFVECLYVNFDFDSAQKKLRECESVSNHVSNLPKSNSFILLPHHEKQFGFDLSFLLVKISSSSEDIWIVGHASDLSHRALW